MAVAFDVVGPSSAGANGTASPLSWSHSPAAGAALVAGVVLDQATTSTTVSATFNSVSMTLLGSVNVNNGNSGFLYVFGIANVSSGAQTVAFTFSGTTDVVGAGSVSFTGAAATAAAAFGTFQSTTPASTGTTSSTPSLGFTTTSSSTQLAGFNANGWPAVPSSVSGATQQYAFGGSSAGTAGAISGVTAAGTGSTVTVTWTLAGAATYAIGGVEVLPPSSTSASDSDASGAGAESDPAAVSLADVRHWM